MITWADLHHDFQKQAVVGPALGFMSKLAPVAGKLRGWFGRKPPVTPLGVRAPYQATPRVRAGAPAATTPPTVPMAVPAGAAPVRAAGVVTPKAPANWGRRANIFAGTTFGTNFLTETIGNGINAHTQNKMLERGIRDHASGVPDGAAMMWQSMANAPFAQKAMMLFAPQKALNSRAMYDQISERVNSMGGEASHYAPGVIERFYAQAQPGAKPLQGPMPGAKELAVYNLDEKKKTIDGLLSQMRQEQTRLAQRAAANQ